MLAGMAAIDTGRVIAKIIDFLIPKAQSPVRGFVNPVWHLKKRSTGKWPSVGCGGMGTGTYAVYFA